MKPKEDYSDREKWLDDVLMSEFELIVEEIVSQSDDYKRDIEGTLKERKAVKAEILRRMRGGAISRNEE